MTTNLRDMNFISFDDYLIFSANMQVQGDDNPFSNLVTVDYSFLEDSASRTKCPKCNKSRKYYCYSYSCCIALPHLQEKIPKVKLPLKVDIIKHPKELDGKSTAPHAAILAPDDVTIYTYPCIPDYNHEKVILVFPGEDSVSLAQLKSLGIISTESNDAHSSTQSKDTDEDRQEFLSNSPCSSDNNLLNKSTYTASNTKMSDKLCDNLALNDAIISTENTIHNLQSVNVIQTSQTTPIGNLKRKRSLSKDDEEKEGIEFVDEQKNSVKQQKTNLQSCPFEKVVFIDCTWNQTKQIVNDERLKGLKKIELKSELTHFWRTQEGMPKTYLSTIEAIYFFFKDFHTIFLDPVYKHEYDNLLMFFCFMYNKIKQNNDS